MKIQNQYFSALIKKTAAGPARLVFIVPKRLAKLATLRNRTKRVFSEAFLPLLSQIKPGYWIALYSKKIFLKESPKDLTDIFKTELKNADLL